MLDIYGLKATDQAVSLQHELSFKPWSKLLKIGK